MAKVVRGPWTLKWGENTITDVTEIAFNYDPATNDYETVQGDTYQFEGNIASSVDLTLLATDVDALRVLFPQYYVPTGGTLSTGETVTAEDGAIDIVAASCESTDTVYPLDVISCNGEVTRIPNAKTALSGIDIDGTGAKTVTVSFRKMPGASGTTYGAVQMFAENGITPAES